MSKAVDDESAVDSDSVAGASTLGRKHSDECQTHLVEALAEMKQQRL